MATDILTLEAALLGGPGLDGYAYNAAVYCVDCGQAITREVFKDYPNGIKYPDAQDSDTLPQPIFFGESDTAQHCDECGEYLYGPQDWQLVPSCSSPLQVIPTRYQRATTHGTLSRGYQRAAWGSITLGEQE